MQFLCTILLILQWELFLCSSPYRVDDVADLGKTFDGLGGISGGGATSKLLFTYPPDIRSDILDILFKPNFAASLHILKVEIGGDGQSTEGTEASHMHSPTADDSNYERGYEWDLMMEAKKRNPDIILVGLPWTFPGWLSNSTQNPWLNSLSTADYIVKWVQGAKTYHNLTIDYLGLWNEPAEPINQQIYQYAKVLRQRLDKVKLTEVQLIAGDTTHWDAADVILGDKELAKVIDVIGSHYPGEVSTPSAILTGKVLWASEDYSTANDHKGAGCLARINNRNYVNGGMTSTIAWNMLAAYYDSLPYPKSGLFTANQPWSGHYTINSPVWIMAHTTQFTKPGWSYLGHSHGVGQLNFGGTYVSFINPERTELTIVVETMSWKNSKCIRPHTPMYNVSMQDLDIQLGGSFKYIKKMPIWVSRLYQRNPALMIQEGTLEPQDGHIHIKGVGPDMVITITTLLTGNKGKPSNPIPAPKPFPLTYKDDFVRYKAWKEPDYLTPQIGSFEVVSDPYGDYKYLTQTVRYPPVQFCKGKHVNGKTAPITQMPLNISSYTEGIHISIDLFSFMNYTTPNGVFLAVFVEDGGCAMENTPGLFMVLNNTGTCGLYNRFNFTATSLIKQTNCTFRNNAWCTLEMYTDSNGNIDYHIDGKLLMNIPQYKSRTQGFLALGCTDFLDCRYDHFIIEPNQATKPKI